MSTRAQIWFAGTGTPEDNGAETIIYRHSDGYPEGDSGVLATLLPFASAFQAMRGNDAGYWTAQYLMAEARGLEVQAIEREKRHPGSRAQMAQYGGDFLSYGLDSALHGDLSFLYVVRIIGDPYYTQPMGPLHASSPAHIAVDVHKVGFRSISDDEAEVELKAGTPEFAASIKRLDTEVTRYVETPAIEEAIAQWKKEENKGLREQCPHLDDHLALAFSKEPLLGWEAVPNEAPKKAKRAPRAKPKAGTSPVAGLRQTTARLGKTL